MHPEEYGRVHPEEYESASARRCPQRSTRVHPEEYGRVHPEEYESASVGTYRDTGVNSLASQKEEVEGRRVKDEETDRGLTRGGEKTFVN